MYKRVHLMNLGAAVVAISVAAGCADTGDSTESEQDGTATEALVAGSLYAAPFTAPAGGVWIPGAGALPGHEWVSDHLQGFCRVDQTAPGSGIFAVNPATCISKLQGLNSAGQAVFRRAGNGNGAFVCVPDSASKGTTILRLSISADGQTITDLATIGPQQGLSITRPQGAAMSSNGVLYVSSRTTGDIWRITNPGGGSPVATKVGHSSDGGGTFALAIAGTDLYVAEKNAVTVVRNVDSKPTFTPGPTLINVILPTAVTFAPKTNELFIGNAASVVRYPLPSGPAIAFSSAGDAQNGLAFVTGLNTDAAGSLYVADDPTAGLGVNQGHYWRYLAVP
jgi:hypothetical protein